jgi:hypothetical protein
MIEGKSHEICKINGCIKYNSSIPHLKASEDHLLALGMLNQHKILKID